MSSEDKHIEHPKRITVNSIKDSSIKRILKPCEARAGHGAIGLFTSLVIAGLLIFAIIRLGIKLYHWICQ